MVRGVLAQADDARVASALPRQSLHKMVPDVLTRRRHFPTFLEPFHEELLDHMEAVDAVELVDEPRAPRVRVFQDDEVLAGRALEGRARRGER